MTLRRWLGGTYLIGTLLLAISVVFTLGHYLDGHFRKELMERGQILAARLAEDSRLPLIQSETDSLRPRLEIILADSNVTSIAVVTAQGVVLTTAGQPLNTLYVSTDRLSSLLSIEKNRESASHIIETDDTLVLIAVVPSSPPVIDFFAQHAQASTKPIDPLGFVILTLTKVPSQTRLRAINRIIYVAMLTASVLFTIMSLTLLNYGIHPLKRLALTMSDPKTITQFRHVKVRGVWEAQQIATAFNTLIDRVADSQSLLNKRVEEAIREIKQQNAELIVAREQAEAASRAKSQFVASMSHEIRTPLHGFMGFIDILDKTSLNPTQRSYLYLLKHTASSLSVVINGVLDFSKLEAGKIVLQSHPFPLRDTIETTVQLFLPNAQAKKLILEVVIAPNLPAWVLGDRHRFAQIIRNLVDNAIKFTEHGKVKIYAHGIYQYSERFLCHLRVQDTGIGIAHNHQAALFVAFHQIDSSRTRQQEGTGLGLVICQQLAELMKGHISVTSQEGQGSEFQLTIPFSVTDISPKLIDESPSVRSTALPPPQLFDDPISKRHLARQNDRITRVLVVDDNVINRMYSKVTLSHFETQVVLADSGYTALKACQQQQFDMILMDIRMPGLDGLETTRRIRQWHTNPNHTTPIIGLTADLLNVDHLSWQAAGMNDCLFKPVTEEQMAQIFLSWGIDPR